RETIRQIIVTGSFITTLASTRSSNKASPAEWVEWVEWADRKVDQLPRRARATASKPLVDPATAKWGFLAPLRDLRQETHPEKSPARGRGLNSTIRYAGR